MKASLTDEAKIKRHGYSIEHVSCGHILYDSEGYSLQVEGYGGVSPTRWEAVAETLSRIEQDERLAV